MAKLISGRRMIGVIGGMGPFASARLFAEIVRQSLAPSDQDHLPIVLCSMPELIPDRSEFLLGQSRLDPTPSVMAIMDEIMEWGASVLGIPCNTLHAPLFFDRLTKHAASRGAVLINMVVQTVGFVMEHFPAAQRVGVLCTAGAAKARVYHDKLVAVGLSPILPQAAQQESVHRAIYDTRFGIKAIADPPSPQAMGRVTAACRGLLDEGAEAIILGCTELAAVKVHIGPVGVPIIDPLKVLARALIAAIEPSRLLPDEPAPTSRLGVPLWR